MRRADATARLRAVRASRSPQELIVSLDDPSPEVVRAAIVRLAELEGPRAADPLRARLLDVDLSMVADFATALRRIGARGVVEAVIAALDDERYPRRLAAVRALGALGEKRAVARTCAPGSRTTSRACAPRHSTRWRSLETALASAPTARGC